jgi:hypothetical protein
LRAGLATGLPFRGCSSKENLARTKGGKAAIGPAEEERNQDEWVSLIATLGCASRCLRSPGLLDSRALASPRRLSLIATLGCAVSLI